MKALWKKHVTPASLAPGSVVYTGSPRTEPVRISVIDYDEEHLSETDDVSVEECLAFRTTRSVSWINLTGVHEADIISRIGEAYDIHPLTLEDIVHTDQRPKQDEFEAYQFVVVRMLHHRPDDDHLSSEQVGLLIGDRWVISFQEYSGDVFEPVRERIRGAKGRIRRLGADYLSYALIDTIVDHYFHVIDEIGTDIEAVEESVLGGSDDGAVEAIGRLRNKVLFVRKTVWPVREVCKDLLSAENKLVSQKVRVFFRDVEDHVLQAVEALDAQRELLAGIMDLYQTNQGNRMNEIMKLLTMIGTIFIPLSFLAGLYGMNFEVMPELGWPFGYPVLLLVMAGVATGFLFYFRRKRWL
jgi:magnesium transporter